jgi:hypothetical protein
MKRWNRSKHTITQIKKNVLFLMKQVLTTRSQHCLEQLFKREVVRKETRSDPTDNKKYTIFCKTSHLNALCNEINRYDLPDIDTILSRLRDLEKTVILSLLHLIKSTPSVLVRSTHRAPMA